MPSPFVIQTRAVESDRDVFGHVNNRIYAAWCEDCAWGHWAAEGFDPQRLEEARRGMAILRAEYDYKAHAFPGDAVQVAVWVTMSDQRLRAERRFQIRRAGDGQTLFRGVWKLACFDLDSGRPARMSEELKQHYVVRSAVADALEHL